jgi:ATP synthase protein I
MNGHLNSEDKRSPKAVPKNSNESHASGENFVWSAISTLVAGPAVWGGVGFLLDSNFSEDRYFTAAGVVVGFVTSLYIVYVKYGRD